MDDMFNSRQGCHVCIVLSVMGYVWHYIDKSTNYTAPTGIIIKSNIKIMMCLVFVFYLNKFRTTLVGRGSPMLDKLRYRK